MPSSAYDSAVGVTAETEYAVTPNRRYSVYAITIYLGVAWYYVLTDDGHPWPTWTPASLYEVVDGRLPASWRVGYFRFSREDQYPLISFPEWASDPSFYERLVDGDADATRTFAARRAELES